MTEQEKAAETVKFPQAYEYSTLMELLGVSVSKHLLDEHFTLVWANDFYYQLIGWPKDEYEKRYHNRPDLYYAERDREDWDQLVSTVTEALSAGKRGYRMVSRMRRKNGGHVWVQFSTQFADEYVNGCQVAYTVITNIDDLVRVQREQSVAYESLPGYVAKYRIDREFDVTLLETNTSFRDSFGTVARRREDGLFCRNIRDNLEEFQRQRERVQKGEPLHFVIHVRDRSGRQLWLQINATCVDWQDQCPVYLVILIDITDVTELRRMQKKLTEQTEALKDALAVAEQADRAKTDFLSRMSHEIRTPMNAIIGMTTIAAAYIDDRRRVEDCLEKIGYSSKHLMMLINDVLDMSKISAGKMKIAHDAFDLSAVVESVSSIIRPQAEARKLTFSIPLAGLTDTEFVGDSLRLNQVLLNLLSNAVKFTPQGGAVCLEIRQLQRTDRAARVRFTVSDTGRGMSEAFMRRLFQPFEQEEAEDGPKAGGTGLGMPITKNLVTLMGGTINVRSQVGRGSTFVVELEFELQESGRALPQKEQALEALKVLVADGDRDNCIHTALLLKNLGIAADAALNGAQCLEKIRTAHEAGADYDVCLLDQNLAGPDSVEVTRQVRENAGTENINVIITAYDCGAIEGSGREAGADAFLAKPVFASALYNALLAVTGIDRVVRPAVEGSRLEELAGRRVLLAEDNELNREIAVELLKMADMSVDCAENGREAVERFAAAGDEYDIILMDVQMPVMDGYQATKAIRESGRPRAGTIPIVAMTADAFHEDVVKAEKAGMDGHLAKPIDPDRLYRTIAEHVAGRR